MKVSGTSQRPILYIGLHKVPFLGALCTNCSYTYRYSIPKFLCHKCKIDHTTQVKIHTQHRGFAKLPIYVQSCFCTGALQSPILKGLHEALGNLQGPYFIKALQSPRNFVKGVSYRPTLYIDYLLSPLFIGF